MADRSSSALDWAVAQLPSSEFAVALHDRADEVVELVVGGRTIATATFVRNGHSLSGAPLTIAVLAEDGPAAAALAEELAGRVGGLPAVELLGPGNAVTHVARTLGDLLDGAAEEVMRQYLWACTSPRPPTNVRGRMRSMEPGDLGLVAEWLDDFSNEALRLRPRGSAAWREELRAATGMRLWDVDGTVVSMAMGRRTTPVSARIGPVYTPPGRRGSGYAAALTAALSVELLADGLERVVLLTDLTNATSNRLYPRVGFVEVGPHESWVVRPPTAPDPQKS